MLKQFFKDNIVLTLSLCLPLLLVFIFWTASVVPNYIVPNPTYDFLFSDLNDMNKHFVVKDEKLYLKIDAWSVVYNQKFPHLYRYIVSTGKVVEINYAKPTVTQPSIQKIPEPANIVVPLDPTKLPNAQQINDTKKVISQFNPPVQQRSDQMVLVDTTAALKIDSMPIAPDGYRLNGYNDDYPGYSYNNQFNDQLTLSKNGRHIDVSLPVNSSEYKTFIGWIMP